MIVQPLSPDSDPVKAWQSWAVNVDMKWVFIINVV